MRSKNAEKVLNEIVCQLSIVKVFNLYERRNEWVNWDGDTGLVSRSDFHVLLNLDEAEETAESMRKPGSKFLIDEVPAIKLSTKSGFLIVTELFSSSPLKSSGGVDFKLSGDTRVNSILKAFLPSKWFVQDICDQKSKTTAPDGFYFKRTSSPGDLLCWNLTPHAIDISYLQEVYNKLEVLVTEGEAVS